MTDSGPDFPLHPETVGGRYEIERQLREEPWGGVWLARDPVLGAAVGLKLCSREEGGAAAAESFQREARLALQLRYPQILGVFHFGQEDNLLYLVQEAFAGDSLQERLARHQHFSLPQTLNLLEQVAQALAFAHHRGVVHQAFNPLQVLVLGEEVRVANFAFPPPEDEQAFHLELKAYVPPEVLQGESLTPAGNVFSLGVLGFRLAARSLPYPLTFDEPFPYRLETPPVDLEEVPIPLQNLLLQCLAVEPEERFPDAGAFLTQLRQLREPWPGEAREAKKPQAPWDPAARAGALWGRVTEGVKPRAQSLWQGLASRLRALRPGTSRVWWGLGLVGLMVLLLVFYNYPWRTPPPARPPRPAPVKGGPPLREAQEPAGREAVPGAKPPAGISPGEVKAPPRENRYLLIAATYSVLEPARLLSRHLRDKNIKARVVKKTAGKKTKYQVQVGPVTGTKQAEELARRLKAEKLTPKVQKLTVPALSRRSTP
jgi:hypothetical protein